MDEQDAVTDLLALRLSAVPFHDTPDHEHHQQERARADDRAEDVPGRSLSTTRSLPPSATITFLAPIIHPGHHSPPAGGHHPLFYAPLPLLALPPPSTSLDPPPPLPRPQPLADASYLFTLILIPHHSLVIGTLPHSPPPPPHHDLLPPPLCTPSNNWLISGEICMIGDELGIIVQSMYEQAQKGIAREEAKRDGTHEEGTSNRQSFTNNQVSFTGHISALVPGDHVEWIWRRSSRSRTRLEDALLVAMDREAWEEVEEVNGVTQVSLADLEWLDLSLRLSIKPPSDPTLWIHPLSELVSFKCRPSKTSLDRSRIITFAATLPLVGHLISISRDPQDHRSFSFFIQL